MDLTEQYAADMATWRYPEPYQHYDLSGADPGYFLDPVNGFHALVDEGGALIGYRSFGRERFHPAAFRVTIADSNARSRRRTLSSVSV